jgi:hypothetical protein
MGCYKNQVLRWEACGGDSSPHWPPHLMFFYSDTDPAIWGANLPVSPVVDVSDPMEHLTRHSNTKVVRWNRRSLVSCPGNT